ncbi:amidohydrolase family protein [Streptomyces telluris]|uniref:Amidohydrolase family protein n=1 Tax=Streptomyces telluris TaxID=2720021 RepID=A0A9X2RLN1_9ACTN|nr:amidohydrolase family protein [Streptomyces telluris]MCQ8768511.1 amidohydrolase family protein [Streptomyces telluris]NJP77009.1 amidohydrolase family protein [Streptomyces telluris]
MANRTATAPPAEQPPGGGLVDHHCHGVARGPLTGSRFTAYLTESDAPAADGTTFFDSQLGFAVRCWCPPLLGLPAHCPPADYLARRAELGADEVNRRLLGATGITDYVVDTGLADDLTTHHELARAGGGRAHEIVRLETLAEHTADKAGTGREFLDGLQEAVHATARTAVGFKSVAAYRHGLDFDPAPPGPGELRAATDRWLAAREPGGRLHDPVLLRHLLWTAAATALPLQIHTGFGDPDLRLHRSDPALLTDFIKAVRPTGCPLVLLHAYPYHRNAAYLAQVFPHVYADVGLTLSYTGARATAVLAEVLELAPFGKVMFSTDAYGLPELYLVGTRLFTRALGRLTQEWADEGAWPAAEVPRIAGLIGSETARRLYELPA